jgi:hypothetical protein
VTRTGDLWLLGRHRLLCGNALETSAYDRLLGAERAQVVITDPPYNVPIAGHVSGLGKTQHREFAMASGEMSSEAFATFLTIVFHNMALYSTDASLHYAFMDCRHLEEMSRPAEPASGSERHCASGTRPMRAWARSA